MKKILFSFVLVLSMFIGLSFANDLVVEAAEPAATDTFTFEYSYNVNGVISTAGTLYDIPYGSAVNVDEGTQEGKEFVGYIKNGKYEPSLGIDSSIILTENTDLQILYKDSSSIAVILLDANQDFVSVEYADVSGNITFPDPTGYSKPGLVGTGWTTTGLDSVNSSTEFTEDAVAYLVYGDSAVTYTLSVINGTGAGTYNFNEEVTVEANGTGTFDYWEKDGKIVSYDTTYTFTVASNHSLVAVYDTSAVAPTGNFVSISDPYDLITDYSTLVGQFKLGTNEELVEYGIVQSNFVSTPTLSTDHTVVDYSNKYNPNTKEFVISYSDTSKALSQYYRAFVTTINNSDPENPVVTTTYSEVTTISINTVEVWFYNSDGWTGVNTHIWDNGTSGTTWAGVAMTEEVVESTPTGWWYVDLPVADNDSLTGGLQYSLNVVFSDSTNENSKTQDLTLDDTTGLYVTASGGVSTLKEITYVTTRVYFYKADWLDSANIYIWGGTENDSESFFTTFMIQENSTNWYYYDISTSKSTINYIVGGVEGTTNKQSENIEGIYPGQTLYYTIGDTWNGNTFSYNEYTEKPADPV